MSPDERFAYFVGKIADSDEVWGLHKDGWALAADNAGREMMPFWPEQEFAELSARDKWSGYAGRSISLGDFVNKWLPGLTRDGRLVAVFPTPSDNAVMVEPRLLQESIAEALKAYGEDSDDI
jgi:hypothetical protein